MHIKNVSRSQHLWDKLKSLFNAHKFTSYATQIIQFGQGFNGMLVARLPEKSMPNIMAIEHSSISITTVAIKTQLLDKAEADISECRGVRAAGR